MQEFIEHALGCALGIFSAYVVLVLILVALIRYAGWRWFIDEE
jgi:membrane protein YdbS with pleckstrin-like domain